MNMFDTIKYNVLEKAVLYLIEYKDGYGFLNGYKFRKDEKTGYYLSTNEIGGVSRMRLHVYSWIKAYGSLPIGYHIHHIDGDKDNNEPENLIALNHSEHASYHAGTLEAAALQRLRDNLAIQRVKASEWHKSEEGREWHREHVKKQYARAVEKEYTCNCCDKKFKALAFGTIKKFCSATCTSKARRDSGVDDEKRVCIQCGREYITNKYRKAKSCSRSCGRKLSLKNRSE